MRRIFALVLIVLAGRAAAVEAADLVGAWSIDADATWAAIQRSPQFAQVPEQMVAAMKEQMTKQLASATVEFTKDEMVVTVGGQTKRGGYTVTGVEQDALGVDVTDPESKQVQHGEVRIVKDQLFLKQGQTEMVLNRKQAGGDAAPAPVAAKPDAPAATPDAGAKAAAPTP